MEISNSKAAKPSIIKACLVSCFNFSQNRKKAVLVIALIAAIFFALLLYSFFLGAQAHRQHLIRGQFKAAMFDIVSSNIQIPVNYVRGLFSKPETILLDIKFKDMQRLEYLRNSALDGEFITEKIKDQTIPVTLTYQNKKYKAKVGLLGSYLDHVNTDKFSLQVKLKNGKAIRGMRKFSLMHPKVRDGIFEWITHRLLRREGIVALRFDFVNVIINGKTKGIYAIEEGYAKQLIENNGFRAGLLGKFEKNEGGIKVYGEEKNINDPSKRPQILLVKSIYHAWQVGDLPGHKVFDYEKMAEYMAIMDLVNGYHSVIESNLRFYFNPVTGLIEPVGREFSAHPSSNAVNTREEVLSNHFLLNVFKDPLFLLKYGQALEKVSSQKYLDEFFEEVDSELQYQLSIVYRDHPYHYFSKSYLYERQQLIKKKLNPDSQVLVAYYKVLGKRKVQLILNNTHTDPIEITRIIHNQSELINPKKKNVLYPSTLKKLELSTDNIYKLDVVDEVDVFDSNLIDLKLQFRVPGSNSLSTVRVYPWIVGSKGVLDNNITTLSPNTSSFSFLELDETSKVIYASSGNWVVDSNLIIPPGYTFKIGPGVKINLTSGANIISHSPVFFKGSLEKPIIIYSSDGVGQGIVVLNAHAPSEISNVVFEGLSAPRKFGFELTSAVTFYESDVSISHTTFKDNHHSDDSLNIIRSRFTIDDSIFENSMADALDVDFGMGRINRSQFLNCGISDGNGDCLDFSGSQVEVTSVLINGAGDKGISAGENSAVGVIDTEINKAFIAVTSKDDSIVNLTGVEINNSEFGFVAYGKKSEFGPGRLNVDSFKQSNVKELYLIENNSILNLLGEVIVGNEKGLKERLIPANSSKALN